MADNQFRFTRRDEFLLELGQHVLAEMRAMRAGHRIIFHDGDKRVHVAYDQVARAGGEQAFIDRGGGLGNAVGCRGHGVGLFAVTIIGEASDKDESGGEEKFFIDGFLGHGCLRIVFGKGFLTCRIVLGNQRGEAFEHATHFRRRMGGNRLWRFRLYLRWDRQFWLGRVGEHAMRGV